MCAKLSFIAGYNYDNETAIDGGFIYSAGPENIGVNLLDTAACGHIFTNIPLQQGKVYEADFYEWNYANRRVHFGVGIMNTTNKSGSVTVLKRAVRSESTASQPSSAVAAKMTLEFMNDSRSQVTSISSNTDFTSGGFKSLIDVNTAHATPAVGRVRFKVNSSGLYCRIYFVSDQDTVNSSAVAWEKRAGWAIILRENDLKKTDPTTNRPYNSDNFLAGLYKNVYLHADAHPNTQYTFCIGSYQNGHVVDSYNENEFEIPTYTLPCTENQSIGNVANWSIVYSFTCTDRNVRRVKLSGNANNCWIIKKDGVWSNFGVRSTLEFDLVYGSSFWFVLVGGCYGNIKLEYIK